MTISVIIGSTRRAGSSEKPGQWILQQLRRETLLTPGFSTCATTLCLLRSACAARNARPATLRT
jgi:hypothetical protein